MIVVYSQLNVHLQMNFIGRTQKSMQDYETKYMFGKHYMSKDQQNIKKKLDKEKQKEEKK